MVSPAHSDANAVRRVGLLAALVEGDTRTAYGLARDALDDGVAFDAIVEQLLAPVHAELGRRWARGELTVADEHAASAAAAEVLTLLAGALEPGDGPAVVVMCPDGEHHALGAHAVAAHLRLEGARATFLGASLPAVDLADYVEYHDVDAVVLSASMASSLPAAADVIAVAHAHGIPVVVGGRAFDVDERRARTIGADAHAVTLRDVSDTIERWQHARPEIVQPDEATSDETSSERRALRANQHAIVDAALRGAEVGGDAAARLAPEVVRIVDVLDAALLVDDADLVVTHVAWLRERSLVAGDDDRLVDRLLDALAGACGPELGRTRTLCETARDAR
ncbi:MAG TPA: cobalamin-dependent protein [Acidimicrobiia bacterium]|nr:cobalamin-dependent protein [Acidimicrobiia bacterium]